jgi:hypothetical protein
MCANTLQHREKHCGRDLTVRRGAGVKGGRQTDKGREGRKEGGREGGKEGGREGGREA